MWETWVQFLGWEDPLEKGIATHSNILAWRSPWTEDPGEATDHGATKSQTQLSDYVQHSTVASSSQEGFPGGSVVKNLPADAGDVGSSTGLGRSPGERKGKWSRSVVSNSATPWTAAYKAPPSMGFSRQGYWNGLPFPSPEDLPDLGTEHCRQMCYCLSHQGSPWRRKWQPTPVFLPEKSHGQRSLAGYNPGVTKSWTWLSSWTTTTTFQGAYEEPTR